MATATNPTPPGYRSVEISAGGVGSPRSGRSTASRGAAVPGDVTSAVVSASPDYLAAGGGSSYPASSEDAVVETQPESSDNSGAGGNAGKKPVWNKPSADGAAEGNTVMGAASWPALSKSTQKSSSSDSLKNLSEGSASVLQGTGVASSSSLRQATNSNENPNSSPKHPVPTRLRSTRRRGGGGGGGDGNSSDDVLANGGFSQVLPPEGAVVEAAHIDAGKHGKSPGESSSRESSHREGGRRGGFGSQLHGGSEHPQQRNSFRRGNGGPHSRWNGPQPHNYGGRRDQDRGNQDWNPHRNFGGRDAHMQPQRGPSRPFVRGPPHANMPYFSSPIPMRPPFGTPMVYPDVPPPVLYVPGAHPDPFRAVPMVAPMPPLFIPLGDPHLQMKIINQINYYFSDENLVKDTYLRQNMDEQGWVPIKLIAGFKKVSQLTDNIQIILSALHFSSIVEVEGEKVRRRNDWGKWIIRSSVQYSTVAGTQQALHNSSHDMLPAQVRSYTG